MAILKPKIVKYAFTAGAAAGVDLGLFWLLSELAIPLFVSAIASFLVASVVNYMLSARYVFGRKIAVSDYFRFLVAASLGFSINVVITIYFSQIVGLAPPLAKAIGIGLAFFANFAMNAVLVFPESRKD